MATSNEEYNMPAKGLFGYRCKIPTGMSRKPFVYRIVSSDISSNSWCEPPIMARQEPFWHDHTEKILIVVLDTLITDQSKLLRVALKDVELMEEL